MYRETAEKAIRILNIRATDVSHRNAVVEEARSLATSELLALSRAPETAPHDANALIAFAAVLNDRHTVAQSWRTLLMGIVIEIRESMRRLEVAHDVALMINAEYDALPSTDGNRLYHAMERILGVGEAMACMPVSRAAEAPPAEQESTFNPVRFVAPDGVLYEYDEDADGCGLICESVDGEWHFVCWTNIDNPTPENVFAAVPKSDQAHWGKFSLVMPFRRYSGFTSAKAARDWHNAKRDEMGLGASEWPTCAITDGENKVYLSYNGRAWSTPDFTGSEVILSDSCEGFSRECN